MKVTLLRVVRSVLTDTENEQCITERLESTSYKSSHIGSVTKRCSLVSSTASE